MTKFQILSVLFALFMIYTVGIHSKKKTLSTSESSLWYSLWSLFIVVAVFPGLLSGIASTLKFTRVFDFLIVISFMILSIVTFNNYYSQKKSQSKLEEMVRTHSITKKKKTGST